MHLVCFIIRYNCNVSLIKHLHVSALMCHPQEVYDYKRVEMAHFNIGRQYQY